MQKQYGKKQIIITKYCNDPVETHFDPTVEISLYKIQNLYIH